jgi:hypothetical protein
MSMNQKADIYQPIEANRVGPAPLVIRTIVTPSNAMIAGGAPMSSKKIEDYVLLSALPKDLQERVKTAVQALVAGM